MSVIVFILTKKFKWITIHFMILPFSADIYTYALNHHI